MPQNFSPPEAVGKGRWRIDMIATRIVFDAANPSGQTLPFNRTFYVKAIQPPQNPLTEKATEYQRIIYTVLEGGIQIEEIRPLAREDFTP